MEETIHTEVINNKKMIEVIKQKKIEVIKQKKIGYKLNLFIFGYLGIRRLSGSQSPTSPNPC